MNKWQRGILTSIIILVVLFAAGWGYLSYKYPYGYSHRCSKILAGSLLDYAENNSGRYPNSNHPEAFGISVLLNDDPNMLEFVVGKAGNLDDAKEFYEKHGYITPNHSSWHYVHGLTTTDKGKALLWDKVPLDHNGGRTKANTREVIMTDGSVKNIPANEWDEFLKAQNAK